MRRLCLACVATVALALFPFVAPQAAASGRSGAIHPPVEALARNR